MRSTRKGTYNKKGLKKKKTHRRRRHSKGKRGGIGTPPKKVDTFGFKEFNPSDRKPSAYEKAVAESRHLREASLQGSKYAVAAMPIPREQPPKYTRSKSRSRSPPAYKP